MKIDKKRLLWSLGIGFALTIPILYVYAWGDGSEDTLINAAASILMVPAMILAMPSLFLAPLVADPDRYVLGVFFYSIPFISVAFYTLCGYGVLSLIAKKK